MTAVQSVDGSPWAIPPEALPEWLRLAALVDEIGAVPCRTSDPEAWWPNRNAVDHPPARMAREACFGCEAKAACLDYALAADEPEGIWGGLTAQEREGLSRQVSGFR